MSWRDEVRKPQAQRRRRFFLIFAVLFLVMTGILGAGWLGWRQLLDETPPGMMTLEVVILAGDVLLAVAAALGLVLPFKGTAPEEAAADAFFEKRDVRSDDHDFERNLQP